jgi:hypothetical protein
MPGGKHVNMQAWAPEEDQVILDMVRAPPLPPRPTRERRSGRASGRLAAAGTAG